ncbi:MAG: hypothetical protein FFODKBPE_00313 [Candidatus Argoarchaeum ethanivorans]|uniref:Uncharacterized protein n=1 Tax=Candidatus Argoarchaeum ethanivorans TaxID=2608793 RepID=A0A811TCI8_9EURY|nr:MAG: hypothetical protein FFODKBPE_00313 [Candidatus Argoarchaeum ethanivorans]
MIPEKVKEVSEKEKPGIMEKYIKQLEIYFNDYEPRGGIHIYEEREKELCQLAGQISKDFDEKTGLLINYIESWGDEALTDDRSFGYLKKFLKGFSPYLTKYGYYFNIDITQAYPKPVFIGRITGEKEASMVVDYVGEKRTVNIIYLERINADNSSWQPESPFYLLPITEEIIIFEDLLLAEAKECAERIMFESEKREIRSAFVYKQWGEMAGLPEEKIIEKIKNDLRESYTIGAIRDAFNRFFLKTYEKYMEEDRDYLSELSRRLAMLSLGPLPHYFTKDPEPLVYNDSLKEICAFMLEKMEGLNTPGKVVIAEDIFEQVPLLVSYDKAVIRKLAEAMYKEQFNDELAVGYLKEIKARVLADNLNVEGIMNGTVAMDDVTFNALEGHFIKIGDIGNDDKIGWDVLVKTLALKEIKPEDLIIKKIEDIIPTKEKWEGLVKLYPYLKMMKYDEVKDGKYLNAHWCALKRVITFNKYKEELDISQFRKERNYIEDRIKEYSNLLKNVRELFKANEKKMSNLLNREENEIPMLNRDYGRTIEGLDEEISLIKEEIRKLKEEEVVALNKKTMIFFGPSNEKKEEIKNKTEMEVEEKEERIEQDLTDIEDFKNKKEVLGEEISIISVKEDKIKEEFKDQEKQIRKYNEISNELAWNPERE